MGRVLEEGRCVLSGPCTSPPWSEGAPVSVFDVGLYLVSLVRVCECYCVTGLSMEEEQCELSEGV